MDKARRDNPPVEHPVIRTHPVTGRKSLYISESFTTHIPAMTEGESRAVLGHLVDHLRTPEFQTRLRWRANTLAFWDNRCSLHYAVADYWPQHRLMHRISIRKGEVPV
jgi:taurine dioxygenase